MEKWFKKVAVVTGANSGIGAAVTDALLENGVKVVGLDMRVNHLEEKQLKYKELLFIRQIDLREEEQILTIFQWIKENLSCVHILVNCAGIIPETNLSDGNTALWRDILNVNVLGLCIATREAVKIMKENQVSGHIIHINSVAGHKVVYYPNCNLYPATKYAVTALTETLRRELGEMGSKIKITSVSPGAVATGLTTLKEDISEDRRQFLEKCPMLQPQDIANGIIYVLGTPEHVQVQELTIKPVGEHY